MAELLPEEEIRQRMLKIKWYRYSTLKQCWKGFLINAKGYDKKTRKYKHPLGYEVHDNWTDEPGITAWGWSNLNDRSIHFWVAKDFDILDVIRAIAHELGHLLTFHYKNGAQEESKALHIDMIAMMAHVMAEEFKSATTRIEKKNAASLKHKNSHKKAGLCRDCNNKVVKGYKYCEYHLDRNRKRAQLNRETRRKEGRCIRCGGVMIQDCDEGHSVCINCSMKKRLAI